MLIWPEGKGGHLFQVESHVTGGGRKDNEQTDDP